MKTTLLSLVISAVSISAAEHAQSAEDDAMSLLQHSARPVRKMDDSAEAVAAAPPAGTQERIRARRDSQRDSDRVYTPEQIELRKARRKAKREARRQGHLAGARHFGDGGECDTCLVACEELFQDTFKACMLQENCQPWQKEDGPTSDKCKRRCDRVGNWKREPCNRLCECDGGAETSLVETTDHWANGLHRCRDSPIGMISDCATLSEEPTSFGYDSIKKCSKAAVETGADTFNFYRTSKQFGKCTLKTCGSSDLKLINAEKEENNPAGRGSWKVFSTYCAAPPVADRSVTGSDENSR